MSTKANIGSLIVSVLANTTGFDTGMRKAGKGLKGFEKQLDEGKAAIGRFKTAIAGIAAGLSVGALASKFKQTAAELDNLAKTSAKIGIGSEKLAAFRFAGEQTGVAVQTMDNALTKLTLRIAEASKGLGEAKDVLKELNLDVEKLKTLTPDQQFLAIARAMQGVTNHSDKLRIATKLFEEEGMALVNTLALGEEGLRKMEQEAKRLGITFSNEELAKVEAFNDAMNRLSKSVQAIGGRIVIDIAPQAEKGINALAEALEGAKLGSGRNAKGESTMRQQFRWTMGIADFFNKNWIQPATESAIRGDLKNKVGAGTAAPSLGELGAKGVASVMARNPGFDPSKVQAARDGATQADRFEKQRHRMFSDGIDKAKKEYHRFFNEDVVNFFKKKDESLKGARKFLGQWQRGFFLDSLKPRPNMDHIFNKKQEQLTEDSPVTRSLNEALAKGTVEAYTAARAKDTVPKAQLAEAKKHTKALESIAGKLLNASPIHLVGLN